MRFSNPLDEEAFDRASLRVEPALPGLEAAIAGDWSSTGGSAGRARGTR